MRARKWEAACPDKSTAGHACMRCSLLTRTHFRGQINEKQANDCVFSVSQLTIEMVHHRSSSSLRISTDMNPAWAAICEFNSYLSHVNCRNDCTLYLFDQTIKKEQNHNWARDVRGESTHTSFGPKRNVRNFRECHSHESPIRPASTLASNRNERTIPNSIVTFRTSWSSDTTREYEYLVLAKVDSLGDDAHWL